METFGIYLYLIAAYIRPQDWIPGLLGFNIVDYIVIFTLFAGLFNFARQKRTIGLPQNYLLLFFLIVVFLSNYINNNSDAAITQFTFFLKSIVIYFMFILAIDSTKKLKNVITFIVIIGIFISIQAIRQSIYGVDIAGQTLTQGYKEVRVQWVGLWDGPNVLCLLFVAIFPFILQFIFGPYGILCKLTNSVFALIALYGIYLTNSRGGFLGLLSALSLFCWNRFMAKKRLFIKIFSLTAGLIIISLFLKLGPSRMSELNTTESSARERTWLWEQGIDMLRDDPTLGIGKGQFSSHSSSGLIAHNNYVQSFAETGIIGFFIFLSLIYFSFKSLIIAKQKLLDSNKNKILLSLIEGLLLSLVAFNVTTFFVTMENDVLFVWWALCAAALNITRKETSNFIFKFSFKDAVSIGSAMIAIILFIYLVAVKNIF